MALAGPQHAVVGARDVSRTVDFLTVFGFAVVAEGTLGGEPAAVLYGLEGPAREVLLAAPGAAAGHVRVVATSRV